jgi:hypothetical protein
MIMYLLFPSLRVCPMVKGNQLSRGDAHDEPAERSVAAHVRERQRAVASRLVRPEQRRINKLAHADLKKSAVSSTPFGIHRSTTSRDHGDAEEWCGPFSVKVRLGN